MIVTTEAWLHNRLENLALLAHASWRADSASVTQLRSVLAAIELSLTNALRTLENERKQEKP